MKKKGIEKVVSEFMLLDTEKRTGIFQQEYDRLPGMAARARLFVSIPIQESVRLMETISGTLEMNNFLFDRILDMKEGKDFLLKLLPQLTPERLNELLFSTGPFTNFDALFEFLPLETVITIVNHETHDGVIFEKILQKILNLVQIKESTRIEILRGIEPRVFASMAGNLGPMSFKNTEGFKITTSVAGLKTEKKIAELCAVVPVRTAVVILKKIESDEIRRKVLQRLDQKYRDAFFQKTASKKTKGLRAADVEVTSLDMTAKKEFFKRFPRSGQLAKLSVLERIEVICD